MLLSCLISRFLAPANSACGFLLVFLIFPSWTFSQAQPPRLSPEEQVVLVRNETQLLPVATLDQNILVVSVGLLGPTPWQQTAGLYTRIKTASLSANPTDEQLQALKLQVAAADICLIGLHGMGGKQGQPPYAAPLLLWLRDLAADDHIAFCQFGWAERLAEVFPIHPPQSLLWTTEAGAEHQNWAAQVAFGGMACRGSLPLTSNHIFQQGAGLNLPGGLRFQYTEPEAVGWNGNRLHTRLDSIVQIALDSAAFPGCQLLVAKDGKVVHHRAYGFHTYEKQRAVKLTDLYDYASMTKVTGALPALMWLRDEGKFELDAPFERYWPDLKGSNKADLSMRRVLAHGAALQSWIAYYEATKRKNGSFRWRTFKADSSARFPTRVGESLYLHRRYPERMYQAIRKSPLRANNDYLYSGLSFYLYPQIVKNLTGEDYEEFCKETFYEPLGASTITYNPWRFFPKDQIVPTERDTFFRQTVIQGFVHDEGAAMMGGVSSNAGLFSTANDLAKLFQMYLNLGEYGGHRYLSRETMQEFTRYQFPEENNRRGLGFDKPLLEAPEKGYAAPSASAASFGHSGFTGTYAWADPETGILIVLMSNRVHPTRENRKLYSLGIRPALHEVMYEELGRE